MSGSRSVRAELRRTFVAASVALLVVVGLVGYGALSLVGDQTARTTAYFDATSEASAVERTLDDADDLLTSYAQTGDEATGELVDSMLRGWETSVFPDGAALGSSSRQLEDLRVDAERSVETWVGDYADDVATSVKAGDPVTSAEQQQGNRLFAQARAATDDYSRALDDQWRTALEHARAGRSALIAAVAVLAVLCVAVAWWLWRTIDRRVTRPVRELAADVRRATSGDHSRPVARTGTGEIADLAVDVERLRDELVRQAEATRRSKDEVEESHRQLEEQAAELERSNRDLEQFAYVASHDLQEPLRKVASFTQLLQKRYGGQLDERADQYIEFAVDGAKRMQRLIQDLLGFSRVGRSGAEQEDVDLGECLDDALASLSERLEEAGACVTHDSLPVVHGERALLTQLFVNVVGNAVKFRHPDRPPHVHVGVRSDGTHWELSCADDGIGIEPQYAERVFVIFQRLHPKDVYGGTGIGLALCKRIVEHHGGQIWIEPGRDEGTVVRWTLAHRYVSAASSGTSAARGVD